MMKPMRRLLLAAACAPLAACGFQPLYAGPDVAALSAMEIEAGQARIDYLLEDAMSGAFGSGAGESPYRLVLDTETDERRLGISAADRASRYGLDLRVRYRLVEGDAVLAEGLVRETAYFDAPFETYGLIAARRNAEEQAALAAARTLSRRLAAATRAE